MDKPVSVVQRIQTGFSGAPAPSVRIMYGPDNVVKMQRREYLMDRPIAIHLNPMNLPKLNVTDVLIDVIRFPARKLKRAGGVGIFCTLTEILAAQQSVLIIRKDPWRKFVKWATLRTSCLFTFLPALNVSRGIYWQKLQEWVSTSVDVSADAPAISWLVMDWLCTLRVKITPPIACACPWIFAMPGSATRLPVSP